MHRQKIKLELVADLDLVNGFSVKNPTNDMLYIKDTVSRDSHVGTIFHDKLSKQGINTTALTVNSFRTLLAEYHRQVIGGKDHRRLISPGSYDPNLAVDTARGIENLVDLSGVWMDNDGGDLTPDAFAKMLKVPLVIFNTYSSTVEKPRWRVWIPTSHLLTKEAHRELIAQICKMLIDRKFYGKRYITQHPDRQVKHHGFDEGKFAPTSLFYLPAQAAAGADASFFLEYNWQHELLNPYQWIDRSIIDYRQPTVTNPSQPLLETPEGVDEAKIEKADDNWNGHPAGEGNRAFWKLAVAYRHAGLSWSDAEPRLRYQAGIAHGHESTVHRLRDLKSYQAKIWR